MKRIIALVLVFILCLSLCACGAKKSEQSAGLPNPVHECSLEELVEATGIGLDAPEGAEDILYSYIDVPDAPISQVTFTLNGNSFCYRAQPTMYVSISANVNEDGSGKELADALNDCTNIGAALSGLYYEWKCSGLTDIAGSREAVFAFNEGKDGFISWLDVVPGVLYSLSIDDNANQMILMDTAEACFVPLQGDVG